MKNYQKIPLTVSLIGVLYISSSCSSFREIHYFKDKIERNPNSIIELPANYYKVEIKGYSFLSSSRYVSGYFDQGAINLYFNEFSQPENGRIFGMDSSGAPLTDENGNELVLILSTNSKAITDQIGNIAKNQTILNSIAKISQKDQVREAEELKLQSEIAQNEIKNFIFNTDIYLKDISKKTPQDQILSIDFLIQTLTKK